MSNVELNPGTGGATLGTDQVAGTPNIDYQIVKIGYSVAGSAPTQVSTTNPLPISDAGGSLTVDGTVAISGTVAVTDNSGSLTVDNGGTFAVQAAQSGTWNINNVSGTVSLPTGAATAAKQPALGTAGTASADVITVQGIASMTKLLVTPDSVALPANQSVNVNQLAGTTTDTNSGTKSAGTLRVVIATDQPALTNKLLVTPDSVALPANQSVNVSQINGVTPLMGNGVTGTGSQRVTIASDNSAFSVNAVQSGTWTVQPGNTANTSPWLTTDTPATSGGLSFAAIVASAATNNKTQVKGSAGQLYCISAQNLNASPRYLKVFNNTSAGVTMGTTSADYQFIIPGNTAGAGLVLNIDKGIAMGTGITIAVTGAIGATDNTSISANEVTVLVGYK
ncbi:MAG TPA: hypothetical protein VHM25_18910 [Polyangiaceae bacterium]|nr:hypothetical protein [Polyangiaceae bacterium]